MTDQQLSHHMSDETRRLGLRMAELLKEKGADSHEFKVINEAFTTRLVSENPALQERLAEGQKLFAAARDSLLDLASESPATD